MGPIFFRAPATHRLVIFSGRGGGARRFGFAIPARDGFRGPGLGGGKEGRQGPGARAGGGGGGFGSGPPAGIGAGPQGPELPPGGEPPGGVRCPFSFDFNKKRHRTPGGAEPSCARPPRPAGVPRRGGRCPGRRFFSGEPAYFDFQIILVAGRDHARPRSLFFFLDAFQKPSTSQGFRRCLVATRWGGPSPDRENKKRTYVSGGPAGGLGWP